MTSLESLLGADVAASLATISLGALRLELASLRAVLRKSSLDTTGTLDCGSTSNTASSTPTVAAGTAVQAGVSVDHSITSDQLQPLDSHGAPIGVSNDEAGSAAQNEGDPDELVFTDDDDSDEDDGDCGTFASEGDLENK